MASSAESLTGCIEMPTAPENEPSDCIRTKIARVLRGDDPALLLSQQAPDRETVLGLLDDLSSNKLNTKRIAALLDTLDSPRNEIDEPQKLKNLCRALNTDNQEYNLAFFSSLLEQDFSQQETILARHVKAFYRKYPDPLVLENGRIQMIELLRAIRREQGRRAREKFRVAYEKFCLLLYGQQHRYWKQFRILRESAARQPVRLSKQFLPFKPERPQVPQVLTISHKSALKILREAEFRGPDWYNGDLLTPRQLEELHLLPVFCTTFGEATIYLSKPYQVDERQAFLAFVRAKNDRTGQAELVARSFISSNSQAMWRYVPDLETDEDGDIAWFGKGYREESLHLPAELQKVLSEILTANESLAVPKPDSIIALTCREATEHNEPNSQEQRSYYRDVERRGFALDGELFAPKGEMIAPEDLVLKNSGQQPAFSQGPDFSWRSFSPLYKHVNYDAYTSRDGSLRFVFCRTHDGRAWLGSIELAQGKLLSNGLRPAWIQAGDLTTPAYEYLEQSFGYGGARCPSDNNYVDLFAQYLSHVPLIKEYLKHCPETERYWDVDTKPIIALP